MSTRIAVKVIAVVVIAIALLIPLSMIRGVVKERSRFRQEARHDVAKSWTGAQDLLGPILRVPLLSPEEGVEAREHAAHYILPDDLDIKATLRTETRKRGLYAVPVYITELVIVGSFDTSSLPTDVLPLVAGPAELAIAVSDNRGLTNVPTVLWDTEEQHVLPGTGASRLNNGVHVELGSLGPCVDENHSFRIELELRGMERLSFAPVGRETRVDLMASWPHPSFTGRFLPVEHEIDSKGFHANWSVSHLATSAGDIRAMLTDNTREQILGNNFGVSLIDPIDIYQQTMRSIKYGNLFVVVTFTAFFLVEIMRKLMLHPMQYLLVGLALVIFFLLLLSLSEHMGFGVAYLIAAAACIGLIGIYMSSVLGKLSNAVGIVAVLSTLYGMLYAILIAEDIALFMGSLLLFTLLAIVMIVTRKLDWYKLGGDLVAGPKSPGQLGDSV